MATPGTLILMRKWLAEQGLPELPRERVLSFVPRLVTMNYIDTIGRVVYYEETHCGSSIKGPFAELKHCSGDTYFSFGLDALNATMHLMYECFIIRNTDRRVSCYITHGSERSTLDDTYAQSLKKIVDTSQSLSEMHARARMLMPSPALMFPKCQVCNPS